MRSIVWSEEESNYLRALLAWEEPIPDSVLNRRLGEARSKPAERKRPVDEFRVLVVGAKGTGKTSILTRFCQGTFADVDGPQDPFYERGCRHGIDVDGQYYMIDALEMPSKHLSSDPLLISAIQMTDGAIIVYDVTSPSSLRLAQGIQELIRDTVGGSGPSPAPAMATAASSPITTTHIHSARQRQQTRNQQDIGTTMLLSPTSATTNASTGTRDTRGTLSSGADSGSVASSTTGTTASDSSAPGSPLYIATTNPQPTTPGTLAAAATTPRHQPQQRDYGVILVGNKSDVDLLPPHSQQQRAVSWSEGSRAATAFLPGLRASFVEVSARTGEGVDPLFEAVAREILRLRRASQQRREREAAVRRMEEEQAAKIAANSPPVTGTRDTKKRGLWRRISRPFFRREVA